MGHSTGGPTSKIYPLVNARGLPIQLFLTRSQAHDLEGAAVLLCGSGVGDVLLTDTADDADSLRNWLKR